MSYFELYGTTSTNSCDPTASLSTSIRPSNESSKNQFESRNSFDSIRSTGLESPTLIRANLIKQIETNQIISPPELIPSRMRTSSGSIRRVSGIGKPEIGEKDARRSIDSILMRKELNKPNSGRKSLDEVVILNDLERVVILGLPQRPTRHWNRPISRSGLHSKDSSLSSIEPIPISNLDSGRDAHGKVFSMEEIIQRYKSKPRPKLPSSQSLPILSHRATTPLSIKKRILTIDEIVSQHSTIPTKGKYEKSPAQEFAAEFSARGRRDSIDSVEAEMFESFDLSRSQSSPVEVLFPMLSESTVDRESDTSGTVHHSSPQSELAVLLNSSKFTQLITLKNGKTVSLAQVGDMSGTPVLIYLGLGSVRFLIGLYEQIAILLGLRLICIDRWGIGRTENILEKNKSFDRWGQVVEEVMDQLKIDQFSILGHSLGAAFACGSLPNLSERIIGSIHLLSPWVIRKDSVDSLSGNYKLLKYIPIGIVTAVAVVDWKLKAIALGKPPELVHRPIGYTKKSDLKISTSSTNGFLSNLFSSRPSPTSETESRKKTSTEIKRSSLLANSINSPSPSRSSFQFRRSLTHDSSSIQSSPRPNLRNSRASSTSSNYSIPLPPPTPATTQISGAELATALLQASHAESFYSSLELSILLDKKNFSNFTIDYKEMENPIKIWIGDEDERISMGSIAWLKAEVEICTVNIVKGGDHSLMTNPDVVIKVLESIAAEALLNKSPY